MEGIRKDDCLVKEPEEDDAHLAQEGGITPSGHKQLYTTAVEAEKDVARFRPPAEEQTAEIRGALGRASF